jgi:hypothetical protein
MGQNAGRHRARGPAAFSISFVVSESPPKIIEALQTIRSQNLSVNFPCKEVSMKRFLVFPALALALCSTVLLAQDKTSNVNPLIGTWLQNMAKSTYSPGPPPVKEVAVRQYVAGEDGAIVAITYVMFAPEGRPLEGLPSLTAISVAKYDGKEYPQLTLAKLLTSIASHIGPEIDRTISYKAINPYSVDIVQKENGKVVSMSTRTISQDGRTLTDRYHYTNSAGEFVSNVLVFEKQL